jgi:membrane-associated phospholipid phosphatase
MYRLVGASEEIRLIFRPWATDPLGVITLFGGATVLLFALSLAYWLGDRRRIATVVSYAFVALSVVLILKTAIGLPRPPESVRLVAYADDPYGFPSGHAVAAVVVYGGLATVYDRLDRRTLAVVGVVVALIGLSRVVIGVHYLGDVLAGTALGIVLLAALRRIVGRSPLRGFTVAAGCAAVAFAIEAPEATLALGGSLGGVAGSLILGELPPAQPITVRLTAAVVGVPIVFGIDQAVELSGTVPVAVLGNAGLVAVILAIPLGIGRLPFGSPVDASA